jgi:hypothetical protein
MARGNFAIVAYNGGEIGQEVQGRVQLEGYSTTASLLQNFLAEAAGPMSLRPGLKFLLDSPGGAFALIHPFVFSVAQKYLLMLTDLGLRIVANGGVIERPSVTSSVTNGGFTGSLTGWTDISSGGGAAAHDTNQLKLTSDGSSLAGVKQQVSTSSTGVRHALDIVITRGPVDINVGSTDGGGEYIATTTLRTGVYSLAFTPSGSYWVRLTSRANAIRYVDSVNVAAAGDMVLTTPWAEADLRKLRFERKRDVTWINSGVGRKKRLERLDIDSWGLADSTEADGPFMTPNVDQGITLTPSVTAGNGTLTASRALFRSGHVGSLWRVTHNGQNVTASFTAEDQFSNPIRVTGVGAASRTFSYTLSGTWVATVTLQRSVGNTTSWADVQTQTANGTYTVNDGLDNQTIYYRVGVKSGNFTSGTVGAVLAYAGGSTDGIARATGFTSSTVLNIEVLQDFGATTGSSEWAEGAWSDVRGWPKGVTLFDGRKWEGRDDQYWGSVSGIYESYAAGVGDAADAISREIDVGDANSIQWMAGMERLAIGTEGAEPMVRSNAFDEPVTPTNLTLREVGTFGSADVAQIKVDTRVLYVDRSTWRVNEVVYDAESQNYKPRSLMRFHKKIGKPGIVQMAVARQPDTRVYMVRSDGVCLVKLYEAADGMGWARLVTDGDIESVAVLPGGANRGEDEVYLVVKRTVGGADVRYLEEMDTADLDDAADANRLDSYVRAEGSASTTLSGLDHLEGLEVTLWGDGANMGTAVVSGGAVTFPSAKAKRVAGLPYQGLYRSSKLALGAQGGTALGLKGAPTHIAFLLANSTRAVEYGQDFDTMDSLADRLEDSSYDAGPGLVDATTEFFSVPGSHSRDPRLCIRAASPAPVTIQAMVLAHHLDERVGSN